MPGDLETVWKVVDEHTHAIANLETRDAVLESQLNQLTQSMNDLKSQVLSWLIEQRLRAEATDTKIDNVKAAIDTSRGAMSMAKWGVALFISVVTIGVAITAIVVSAA